MTSNIRGHPTNRHETITRDSRIQKDFSQMKQHHNEPHFIDHYNVSIPNQHVYQDSLLHQQHHQTDQPNSQGQILSFLNFSFFPVGEEATNDTRNERLYEPLPPLDVSLLKGLSASSSPANERDADCCSDDMKIIPFPSVEAEALNNNDETNEPLPLPQLETTLLRSFKTNTPRNECDDDWSLTDACGFLADKSFSSSPWIEGDDDCSLTNVKDILSAKNDSTGTKKSITSLAPGMNPSSSSSSLWIEQSKTNNVLSSDNQLSDPKNIKRHHEEKWNIRYKELQNFVQENGHGAVPHTYPKNQQLARWVKRQRTQYKLLQDGKASTITPERLELLNSVGFVWDSHEVSWREKLTALKEFQAIHRHCNVPSNYKDKKLATWVKCQRRQYKLYWQGKASAMSPERILALENLGFEWEIRIDISKSTPPTDDCRLLRENISEF